MKRVTFDQKTLEGLRKEPGADEGKVFNLVRGLQQDVADEPEAAPILQSLKDRADRIIRDLEHELRRPEVWTNPGSPQAVPIQLRLYPRFAAPHSAQSNPNTGGKPTTTIAAQTEYAGR